MRFGILFLKLSVLYFLVGTGLGLTMEILKDHTLSGAHAHINLLGWASLALFGIIYTLFPRAGETTMAKLHFWLYNISLPLFMLALSFMLYGNESLAFLLAISPIVLVFSVLVFVLNVLLDVKPANLIKFNHKR